ncbi:MAG: GNAT family N-acetyltransferase [Firmicutes bacterium]|nr:GNAT family N-acetyltransferase [[Eubacterium] siraeum]MCM1488493.1 GNAT family N-acetyltransferase [Bacillota bacterium]
MDFRLAVMQDLVQLKDMYAQIVKNMDANGICIWDDIYPFDFFEEDINSDRLYVLLNNNEIISAFALCHNNAGEKAVKWNDDYSSAMYIDRFGVNVKYAKQGNGSLMIEKAKRTAKTLGAEYLRLFVVDINEPAIRLYTKNGFIKADGVYNETFDDGFVLREYGYEIRL